MSEQRSEEKRVCSKHKSRLLWTECDQCHGDGQLERGGDFPGDDIWFMTCPSCHGAGEHEYCQDCYEEECCDI